MGLLLPFLMLRIILKESSAYGGIYFVNERRN